jgi:protein arginine kinase activator
MMVQCAGCVVMSKEMPAQGKPAMNCNICGLNEATIHLTEILNSQMVEVHLCENCAQEKGTDFKTHFNFGDLLANLTDIGKTEEIEEAGKKLRCPGCSITYDDFAKGGRLGCSTCYTTFSKLLMPLIMRVQRSDHHIGKKPSKVSGDVRSSVDLRMLQERLRKCVQSEDFEEAASVRDEIKQIQDKMKKSRKTKDESAA